MTPGYCVPLEEVGEGAGGDGSGGPGDRTQVQLQAHIRLGRSLKQLKGSGQQTGLEQDNRQRVAQHHQSPKCPGNVHTLEPVQTRHPTANRLLSADLAQGAGNGTR